MQGDLILGIDIGNTVVKAVLFDATGRQVARHGVDGTTIKPAPGMVERPVAELWRNACAAISGCLANAGVAAERIVAIGLAGHGNGLYLLDKQGAPLLGIQSLDSRAAQLATDLAATRGAALYEICLQQPWPSQTPVLLAWLKANQPETYSRAGTLCFAKDIIGMHLTGARATEVSGMSGAGLLRLPEAQYDAELMAIYGLDDAMDLLPRLCRPTDTVGLVTSEAAKVTGLRPGTPVIAGYFDVIASALGSGAIGTGAASIVLGSWSINQVFTDHPLHDPRVFMATAFGPGQYSSMDNSATSAANLEWYVRSFIERGGHHDDPFGLVNRLVGQGAVAPDDPMFHPFLYGGRDGAHQRGGFFGLAGWHDEGHVLRALFEGVCFEHRRHIDTLRSAGATITTVILSGGGTRSAIWPQMMADILGMPVTLGQAEETGALGGAIAAAVGIGRFATEAEAVLAMTSVRAQVTPDPSRKAVFDRRFSLWARLTSALDPYWEELSGMRL